MLNPFFHCYIIIILSILSTINGRITPNELQKQKVPALYVFGDSVFENGNNNNFIYSVTKANYLPYGIDFPDGATGRFTNGKTVADMMSDNLGLPFSPPYVRANKSSIWLTGYNYASAASGILPESGSKLGELFNMDQQISFFNETIELVLKKRYKNSANLARHLGKSILLFSTGSNDYLNNYLVPTYPRSRMNANKFAELVIGVLSEQIKVLYGLGARKVIFAEVPPVGCIPFVAMSSRCNVRHNTVVGLFNNKLDKLFNDLKYTLPGFQFTVVKSYQLTYDIIANPSQFGLLNGKDSCCDTVANLLTCKREGSSCSNHTEYVFWDSFHPTEGMNSILVSKCNTDKSICTPLNLQQLARA